MTGKYFKGGGLINRYKIVGKLRTKSPLHIGDGNMLQNPQRFSPPDEEGENTPQFSSVFTDAQNRSLIPGSTIKGNLRTWLTQIFTPFDAACINDEKRSADLRDDLDKNKDPHSLLKMSEYLFGSAINEGKLEFWNAPMASVPQIRNNTPNVYLGYDNNRGTIILKSVAIDPATGTSADKKLYNYEVVPEGAEFLLTVCGQNLSPAELGMLLFALEGFNSEIFPLTLGAMKSIGFGRFTYCLETVSWLGRKNMGEWICDALKSGHAGYKGILPMSPDEQKTAVKTFRDEFIKVVDSGGKQPC